MKDLSKENKESVTTNTVISLTVTLTVWYYFG